MRTITTLSGERLSEEDKKWHRALVFFSTELAEICSRGVNVVAQGYSKLYNVEGVIKTRQVPRITRDV